MELLRFVTPLGPMALGAEGDALVRVYLPGASLPPLPDTDTPLLLQGIGQLEEYFTGARKTFDLPLAPGGTPFQQAVWQALTAIPWGETRSYGQIAREIGRPGAARAVGMANHRNPLPILIPCHRVIGAGGRLVGYAGGLELKQALLRLESGGKVPFDGQTRP